MKILFTGGGTLGSVVPLLAVYEELNDIHALWVGTRTGPERAFVQRAGIRFAPIFSGKIRRYLHWRNFIDPFLMVIGFLQALFIVGSFRPDVVVNAGSFVGVPVIMAGWLFRIPGVALQLDVEPVRSNLLTAPYVRHICVGVSESAQYFPNNKVIVTGIPVRKAVTAHSAPRHVRQSTSGLKIMVTGGGIGSRAINTLVVRSLEQLTRTADVFHVTGKDKEGESFARVKNNPRYHPFADRSPDEMRALYARADAVVTRAGMGTLAELSALGKPSLIIPIPHSPQEKNAAYVQEHDAGVVLSQESLSPDVFADAVLGFLHDTMRREECSKNIARLFPPDAALRIALIITNIPGISPGYPRDTAI